MNCPVKDCNFKITYVSKKDKSVGMCMYHREEGMLDLCDLCEKPGCTVKYAYTNDKGEGKFCGKHRPKNPIEIKREKKCQHKDCQRKARYVDPNNREIKRCSDHLILLINMVPNKDYCKSQGCPKHASKGPEGGSSMFCADHSDKNMINTYKIKKCSAPECNKGGIYILNDVLHYCKEHKPEELKSRGTCLADGCEKSAHYGISGGTATHCKDHMGEKMINLYENFCTYPDCTVAASFGIKGQRATSCGDHADKKIMINFRKNDCIEEGCSISASYGPKGGKKIYCFTHKKGDVVSNKKKCEQCNITTAKYNIRGSTEPRFCATHKADDMIDIVSKKCECKDCEKRAVFGKLFSVATHCQKHSASNMYYKRHPICEKCDEKPCYTDDGSNYPKRCFNHKLENDTNVVEAKCKQCGLLDIINESTLMCNDCSAFTIIKHEKKKEKHIKQLIETKYKLYSYDKVIDYGCSRYRPDIVIDFVSFFLVLEIDERQHSTLDCQCEQGRMVMIQQSFGGASVVFIRYNPDSYRANGKLYKSSNKREITLLDLIGMVSQAEIKHSLLICHLFYDGYNGVNEFQSLEYSNGIFKISKL